MIVIDTSLSNELDLDISSVEDIKDEQYDDISFLQKVHKLLFDVSYYPYYSFYLFIIITIIDTCYRR